MGRACTQLDPRSCSSPVELCTLVRRGNKGLKDSMVQSMSAETLIGTLNPIHPDLGAWGTVRRVIRLTIRLQVALGFPRKWAMQTVRLACFVILMMPGLIPPFFSYVFSRHIKKNIPYGVTWRNQLDLYIPSSTTDARGMYVSLPERSMKKAPVVVFISGGGWTIGYKAWAYMMGQLLQKQGILFIAPDYRNFPEVNADGMVDDVIRAMDYVFANMLALGGDPENVTLMGQSAGAHISMLAILEQICQEMRATSGTVLGSSLASARATQRPAEATGPLTPLLQHRSARWSVRSLKRWIGVSGPYDMVEAMPQLGRGGLPRRIVRSVMNNDLHHYSPSHRIRGMKVAAQQKALDLLPPAYLFHGTADKTIDCQQSHKFADVLQQVGARVTTKFYKDKSHTDPVLEDPVKGTGDEFMTDLLQILLPGACIGENCAGYQPLMLLKWAKAINPF